MSITARDRVRQDLVIGRLGGTWLHANHRTSDNLNSVMGVLLALVEIGVRDRNLSSAAHDARVTLVEDYPLALDLDGITEAVAAEVAAPVEDPDTLVALGADKALDAAREAVSALLAEAGAYLDISDGVAVYPFSDDDED